MKLQVKKQVYDRINQFYYNVCLKYPNTYFSGDAERNIRRVYDEVPKVGTVLLQRRNICLIQRWQNYLVDYSKATRWYFAYTKDDITIFVCDAENVRNMSDLSMVVISLN